MDRFKYSYSGSDKIGDKGCRQLAQELPLEEIEELNLDDNNISEKGCEFIDQINHWKKLKILEICTTFDKYRL